MSHNVSMSGIPLKDMTVLKRALAELNKDHNTNFVLKLGNIASRNYNLQGTAKQERVIPNTIAVIHNPNLQFDIAITRDPKTGQHGIEAEALLIEPLVKLFGLKPKLKDVSTGELVDISRVGYRRDEALGMKAGLGPITQRYALLVAEQQAAMSGHSCRRVKDDATGTISLHATVN